jgi:histidine transport system permease protein
MIEILQEFGQAFLYWDGQRLSGLAVTLWLLVASISLGFVCAVPLAVARVEEALVSTPVRLYTYVFRGTPLYVQLLLMYTGMYSLEFVRSHSLLDAFFAQRLQLRDSAFALNTCAYTTEIFAGAIRAIPHGEVGCAHTGCRRSRCTGA